MKIQYAFLLTILFALSSCGQSSENASSNTSTQNQKASNKRSKKLTMNPIYNPQTGELQAHIPLPKKWKIDGNSIVGPKGIKTSDYPFQFFTFQQRRPLSTEQIVREDLAPFIYESGGKILGTFVIPELQNYDRAYSNLLWTFGNPRKEFNVLGVDIDDGDGGKSLLVIRQLITTDQYGGNWGYYVNGLEANASVYEEAKNDYLFALSHIQPNMDAIAAHNQREIQKSNASWAAHSARMAANQAAFNARNQAWMETSNAISDISMKGWRDRNAMNDAGHNRSVNSALEEETIYDPASGQTIQAEAGSNRYFTNGNNEYIRTDDYLYDPNMDNSVNMYEWKEWQGNQ
jgi:hypothetical protein